MRKVILCVMDGVGISSNEKGNAFKNANTPNLDFLMDKYKYSEIEASGKYVGLPDDQIGNSEVGHLTIGAGRVVYQPLTRINYSIEKGNFFEENELINAIKYAKRNNSKLQIMGMLSDGGVHSHINHFLSILKVCKNNNFKNVYFHIFTDGRDTYYKSSIKYLDILKKKMDEYKIGTIGTISGRYYGMDRDNRWERIKEAYDAICFGKGERHNSYKELIESNYGRNITDEFIVPGILDEKSLIEESDSVLWVNFRPDRARQILTSLTDKSFDKFETKKLDNILLTTMMWVSDNVKSNIIFKEQVVDNTLGEYIASKNLSQLRIAETEKYAHVTYFFDGLKDIKLPNENKILIPSPKVATYDLEPKMSAKEITDTLLFEMKKDYDFIFVNFANADMVGHTGNYNATITAVEEIDRMVGKIYKESMLDNYLFIITADHGNCECMIDEDDNIVTKHTNNKVPFIVCNENIEGNIKSLSEVAPFILNIMDLEIPNEMK